MASPACDEAAGIAGKADGLKTPDADPQPPSCSRGCGRAIRWAYLHPVMNESAKTELTEADRAAIVQAYLVEDPSLVTSQEIVKRIAEAHGRQVTTVRGVLVRAGVYIAQPKPRKEISDEDRAALAAVYDHATALERIDILWQDRVAKQFNYQSRVVGDFFAKLKFARQNRGHSTTSQNKLDRGRQTSHYADAAAKLDQSTFQQRLNGDEGWFANPLWVVNTIVVIFLIGLVIAAVSSIFR